MLFTRVDKELHVCMLFAGVHSLLVDILFIIAIAIVELPAILIRLAQSQVPPCKSGGWGSGVLVTGL